LSRAASKQATAQTKLVPKARASASHEIRVRHCFKSWIFVHEDNSDANSVVVLMLTLYVYQWLATKTYYPDYNAWWTVRAVDWLYWSIVMQGTQESQDADLWESAMKNLKASPVSFRLVPYVKCLLDSFVYMAHEIL
jgi:hypothetical protein